jgi:hypothetical protein
MMPQWEEFGLSVYTLVAGFAGGVVKLGNSEPTTLTRWFIGLSTSTITAGYLTPLFMEYVTVPRGVEYSCAFVIGVAALQLINLILKASDKLNLAKLINRGGTDE